MIDRADRCISICEMKYSDAPFVIDKRYADQLRHKKQVHPSRTAAYIVGFLGVDDCHSIHNMADNS